MKKEVMINGLPPEKLGKLIGGLMAAGISPRGLSNVLWLLKYRRQLEEFMRWVKRN